MSFLSRFDSDWFFCASGAVVGRKETTKSANLIQDPRVAGDSAILGLAGQTCSHLTCLFWLDPSPHIK